MRENRLDNWRGIRHSYRNPLPHELSEGGIPRVLYPTPQSLYAQATLSPSSAGLRPRRASAGQTHPRPTRFGRGYERPGRRRYVGPGRTNRARLPQPLSIEASGQFNVQAPPGSPQEVDQSPTTRAGQRNQSRPTSCGLYLWRLEHADDSRPHPEPLWRLVSSALSCDLAPQFGLFLSEGALCLRSSQCGQAAGVVPLQVAAHFTPSAAAKGAVALWR